MLSYLIPSPAPFGVPQAAALSALTRSFVGRRTAAKDVAKDVAKDADDSVANDSSRAGGEACCSDSCCAPALAA